MNTRTKDNILLATAIAIVVGSIGIKTAYAGGQMEVKPKNQIQRQMQDQSQNQGQAQSQMSVSNSNSLSNSSSSSQAIADAAAINEGNELSVNQNYERSAPSVVLVPNNNTESCVRVFGFGGSNVNGSAMFGIPFRSKECDIKSAANDAAAQGNEDLSWVIRCKQKSMKKAFGGHEWREFGEARCLAAARESFDLRSELARSKAMIHKLQYEAEESEVACNQAKNEIFQAACQK